MEPKRITPKIEPTNTKTASTKASGKQPTMDTAVKEPADKVFEPEKMKKSRSGKGLMTLTIILAILAIGAGAFAFWQYTQAKKDEDSLKSAKAAVEQDLAKAKSDLESAAKSATAAKSSDGYIQIKEWGVEYKNPADLGYLVFAYDTSSQIAFLSSTSLMSAHLTAYRADKVVEKADGSVDVCGPQGGALGRIDRGKAGQMTKDSDQLTYDKVSGAKKVGDYYYIFLQPQATCTSYSSVAKIQENQIQTAKKTLDTLRATQ